MPEKQLTRLSTSILEHAEPMRQKILAVEDYFPTLEVVTAILTRADYEVWPARSAREALKILKEKGLPHLALIDINMPGMNGFELCRRIHKFSDLPIILLSGNDEDKDIAFGLDYYAEDYVLKPFRPGELVSRIKRILRGIGNFKFDMHKVIPIDARLQVDFSQRALLINGEQVDLTPTESKILYILMRQAGEVISSDFLLNRIWPNQEAYEGRLHTHIFRLRQKIEIDAKEPTYIVSKWGTGYQFPSPNGSQDSEE